ncbi:MAG: phage tail length tape measure family protein [Betaproteobacteria bacterium]|nr:phage tail length tape measure family protein [Betaproteobacteria bacterium]
MSIQVGTLVVEMSANVARLQQDMESATRVVSKASHDFVESLGKAATAFEAILGGVGVSELFKESVKAASLAEQSSNRLNAVIRATGDTSGYTREQIDKMAETLSKSTTFDITGIQNAQANLLKFGHLHSEMFDRALKDTTDYAQYSGHNMVEASQLIGRAMADPINGVKALGKEFGNLSQTQKDSIQNFIDQGRVEDAAAVILKKIEGHIGGVASAMNTGLLGATTAATKAWDEFLKGVGKTGPVQIVVVNGLHLIADGLDAVTEAIIKQNKAFEKNPLYNGGKLQPLLQAPAGDPLKALQGSGLTVNDVRKLPPGLRPSIVPEEQNSMTVAEVIARGRAANAQKAEEAQARAEAQKKLMKELIPLADELSDAYAAAAIKQKSAAQEMLADYVDAQLKESREFETLAEELGRSSAQAVQNQRAAASDMNFTFQEEENRRLGVLDGTQKRDRLVQILDGMRSQREIEDQDWIEKQQLLHERYMEDYSNRAFWQKKLLQLDKDHQKNVLDIEAEAYTRQSGFLVGITSGLAEVYRTASDSAAQARGLVVNSFKSMEDALVNFTKTGKLDFRSLADSIVSDLIRIRMQQSVIAPLSAMLAGNGAFADAWRALTGGTGSQVPAGQSDGFATGGSFMVGGSGSTDSQPVHFMATPGERVTIQTPGQQSRAPAGGGDTYYIDASGADPGAIARLESTIIALHGSIERRSLVAVGAELVRGGPLAKIIGMAKG